MNKKVKKRLSKIFGCYLPIILFTAFIIFPFYWFLCTSLKEEGSIMELPIRYLPTPFTLDNYKNMLASM